MHPTTIQRYDAPSSSWRCWPFCGDTDSEDECDEDAAVNAAQTRMARMRISGFREVAPGEYASPDYLREQESRHVAQTLVYPRKIQYILDAFTTFQLPAALAELISAFAPCTPHAPYERLCRQLTATSESFSGAVDRISEIVAETGVLTINSTSLAGSDEATQQALVARVNQLPPIHTLQVIGSSLQTKILFETLSAAQCANLQEVEIEHGAVAVPLEDRNRVVPIEPLYAKAPHLVAMTILLPSQFILTTTNLRLPATLKRLHLRNSTSDIHATFAMFMRSIPAGSVRHEWTIADTNTRGDTYSGFLLTRTDVVVPARGTGQE